MLGRRGTAARRRSGPAGEDRWWDPPDQAVAESEKILRTCVHCGFCLATCPTYTLLGDELDSPRGRIYLIKDMLENDKPANEEVALHIDRCLSCLACMTTCPSGVDYMHLVDNARARINDTYKRPWADRFMRDVVAAVVPHPGRFRTALLGARLARPFLGLVRAIPGLARFAPMIALAPRRLPRPADAGDARKFAPAGEKTARVALLRGCAQSVLDPGINEAAVRLLTRYGVEVVYADGDACCGALVHHMGRRHEAHEQAKRAIDGWIRLIDDGGLDAILVTTSGCGIGSPKTKSSRYRWLRECATDDLCGMGLEMQKPPRFVLRRFRKYRWLRGQDLIFTCAPSK